MSQTLREQIWKIADEEFGEYYRTRILDLSAAVTTLARRALVQRWECSPDTTVGLKVAALRRAATLFESPGEVTSTEPAITINDIVADEVYRFVSPTPDEVRECAKRFYGTYGRVWAWVGPNIRRALLDAAVMDYVRNIEYPGETGITAMQLRDFRCVLEDTLAKGVDDSYYVPKGDPGRVWFRIHDDGVVK